ncbi:MAG: FAD:protein FMN transferase [Acidiferrobacterales bacterium]|nr:FAD:protein FMN transferase [Acidiferrobacterales bacterium]
MGVGIDKKTCFSVLVGLICLCFLGCGPFGVQKEFETDSGLSGTVHAVREKRWQQIVDGMKAVDERWAKDLDACNPDSALARLSQEATQNPTEVEEFELFRAVRLGYDWARATDGVFDPTAAVGSCPDPFNSASDWKKIRLFLEMQAISLRSPELRFDLDGLKDGFIIDLTVRGLARLGAQGALLQRGPVTYAGGVNQEDQPWTVPVTVDGISVDLKFSGRAKAQLSTNNGQIQQSDLLEVYALASDSPIGRPLLSQKI